MDPAVKPRALIAAEVRDFLLGIELLGMPDLPELWAWYGAYDHVVLAQLFGSMVNLPKGIPMWTRDLNEELRRCDSGRFPNVPQQSSGVHNALADARHIRAVYEYLTTTEESV
jgi:hypothetical protein